MGRGNWATGWGCFFYQGKYVTKTFLSTGHTLNYRYEIDSILGEGGFGAVYLAKDKNLHNKKVAIKQTSLAVSERESRVLANLDHPGLPKVTEQFTSQDYRFLVMEYVPGDDLDKKLKDGYKFSEPEIIRWGLELCDALSYLHHQNPPIIHCDIKPANIKLKPNGHVVLVDFGIAKFSEDSQTISVAGAVTPGYSPLEQYDPDKSLDARADIYALGATLYTLLTKKKPPPSLQRVPQDTFVISYTANKNLEQVIFKALRVHKEERYQTIIEMKQALEQKKPNPPSKQSFLNFAINFEATASKQTEYLFWIGGMIYVIIGFILLVGLASYLLSH